MSITIPITFLVLALDLTSAAATSDAASYADLKWNVYLSCVDNDRSNTPAPILQQLNASEDFVNSVGPYGCAVMLNADPCELNCGKANDDIGSVCFEMQLYQADAPVGSVVEHTENRFPYQLGKLDDLFSNIIDAAIEYRVKMAAFSSKHCKGTRLTSTKVRFSAQAPTNPPPTADADGAADDEAESSSSRTSNESDDLSQDENPDSTINAVLDERTASSDDNGKLLYALGGFLFGVLFTICAMKVAGMINIAAFEQNGSDYPEDCPAGVEPLETIVEWNNMVKRVHISPAVTASRSCYRSNQLKASTPNNAVGEMLHQVVSQVTFVADTLTRSSDIDTVVDIDDETFIQVGSYPEDTFQFGDIGSSSSSMMYG